MVCLFLERISVLPIQTVANWCLAEDRCSHHYTLNQMLIASIKYETGVLANTNTSTYFISNQMLALFPHKSYLFCRTLLLDKHCKPVPWLMVGSLLGHVRNLPTMQIFTGISRNTQSKIICAIIDCVQDFQNNALWDTQYISCVYSFSFGFFMIDM